MVGVCDEVRQRERRGGGSQGHCGGVQSVICEHSHTLSHIYTPARQW